MIFHLTTAALAYNNGAPHSKLPPLGWSSWVALGPDADKDEAKAPIFDFCDEASVMASIDAYVTDAVGLYKAGYRHFHLDDCWADKERNATGFLQGERDHFPNGMKKIVDYAHSKGLTFGLYTCAGTHTCVGGRPGSKDHFPQDAAVFAEWGVDVVKMDWCNHGDMQPAETYALMSHALNATGRPIHFNMCEWGQKEPWEWGPKVAQSWRATGDHTPVWESTKQIIAQRSAIPASLGGAPYAWNDMDMLETGNYAQAAHANGKQGTMSAAEYKTEFSMWAILASPLVVTTPILNCSKTDQIAANFTPGRCVPSLTRLQREILLNPEVLAINQDVTPAGRKLGGGGDDDAAAAMVYARNLSDGSVAVALYNPEDAPAPASVDFTTLGWRAATTVAVRDLWARASKGVAIARYPATGVVTVGAHETLLLRLTPQKAVALVEID
jgi:alpha-galactosidase